MKNIIVTGGLGFIGYNFVLKCLQVDPSLSISIIDKETYAAQFLLNYKKQFLKNIVKIYKYDINDYQNVEKIIQQNKIDTIVNFAAQSHVDNSISSPVEFIQANINGTFVLLELARKYNLRFHQVSTDEVYGSVDPWKDIVTEQFKYNPSSPYSSSKASADLLVLAYFKTFGVKATISRCTNNYGEWQHPEKLIPKTITNAINNIKIPIYGDGKQVRNWIHVNDHCEGILDILYGGKIGQIYNIGSKVLIPNIDIVKMILKELNKSEDLIQFVKDRPAHDFAYHLNSNKIIAELDWHQETDIETGLKETIAFYKKINGEN